MKKLGLLFVICMLALSAAGTADAFLPKIDAGKGASGVSNIVQKAKAQAEKAMQWISNSKMGKFVGDGISAAKDGMSFMKEQYNNAMKLYGQAQDAIESVKDSKEYQMAMISKEIAELQKALVADDCNELHKVKTNSGKLLTLGKVVDSTLYIFAVNISDKPFSGEISANWMNVTIDKRPVSGNLSVIRLKLPVCGVAVLKGTLKK